MDATILYIACKFKNEEITHKKNAAAANISEVTLGKRKKELVKGLTFGKKEIRR